MKFRSLHTPLLAGLLMLACGAGASPVTWLYDSKLEAVQTATANGDGSYTYSIELNNHDVNDIWSLSFYTGQYSAGAPAATLSAWLADPYSQGTASFGDWTLPGSDDAYMYTFYDAVDYPFFGSLAAGQSATVGFTTDGYVEGPLNFGYFARGDGLDYNPDEPRFTAVGSTVPEPSTMALFGLGALGIAAFARRKSKTAV